MVHWVTLLLKCEAVRRHPEHKVLFPESPASLLATRWTKMLLGTGRANQRKGKIAHFQPSFLYLFLGVMGDRDVALSQCCASKGWMAFRKICRQDQRKVVYKFLSSSLV